MDVLVVTVAVFAVVSGIGWGLSGRLPLALQLEERLGVAIVVGAMSVTLTSLAASYAFGFGRVSTAVGVVAAGIIAVLAGRRDPGRPHPAPFGELWTSWRARLGAGWFDPRGARLPTLMTLGSWVITVRILSLAYRDDGAGGLTVGHLSIFGDWNAHLAYAGAFRWGDGNELGHPFVAGERLTYHVLSDVFGAVVSTAGLAMHDALVAASIVMAFAFPLVFFAAARRIVVSAPVSALAYAIFTLSGGLGFVWVVGDVVDGGVDTLVALPRTAARLIEQDIWFDNPVLAHMYAQRPFQFGLAVVLITVVCIVGVDGVATPVGAWRFGGVIVGASAGFSIFGFGGAAVLALWFGRRDRSRLLAFAVPAVGLAVPVVLAIRPESSSIRWQLGWMASTLDVAWPWFWLLNLGVFVPLAVWALLQSPVTRSRVDLSFAVPVWTIFVVCNLVVFHPWEWNNTHYLLIWLLITSFSVAALLARWWRRGPRSVVVALVVVLVASGTLDVWRAMTTAFEVPFVTADDLALADWARSETAPDAVFAATPTIDQPVVSFGARRVVSGFPGWVWDLGVPDWAERRDAIDVIVAGGDGADALITRYDVDYVVVDGRAPDVVTARANWDARGRLVFESESAAVYAVSRSGGGSPGS